MKIIDNTTDILPESGFDLDSVLFFDIETTGLNKERSMVYLIGCAYKKEGSWHIKQFLAQDKSDEEGLVNSFFDFSQGFETLIHFNGLYFDVPYMDHKAEIYGISLRLKNMNNIDILKITRYAKNLLCLQRYNQKSIEHFLRFNRDDEMSGGDLIPFFYEYEKTHDERIERYLLLHNHDDIKGMIKISPIVNYAKINTGDFSVIGVSDEDNITIELKLSSPIPRAIEKDHGSYLIAADEDLMHIVLRPYSGIARHYLKDYKNYYYLPEEDKVIHKDIAQFVDKEYKRKANRSNCYLKKESVFIPQPDILFTPEFYINDKAKDIYFEASSLFTADEELIKEYSLKIIKGLK